MRRRLRCLAVACLLVAAGCTVEEPPEESRPPNVVLISIDTLRADRTSVYGHSNRTTPRLEHFAAESAVFETAYAPSSTTAPSHASMLTGLYPPSHGVLTNAIPPRR